MSDPKNTHRIHVELPNGSKDKWAHGGGVDFYVEDGRLTLFGEGVKVTYNEHQWRSVANGPKESL